MSTYNIIDYLLKYPNDHNDYDLLENEFAIADKQFGSGIVDVIDTTGLDNNPYNEGTDSYYLSIFDGYIYAPVDGVYSFAVNGDDAVEVIVDNAYYGWYGGHGADGTDHNIEFELTAGYHKLKFRHEEWEGGDSYQLFWKKPGDSDYSIVPNENLFHCALPKPIADYRMDECSWEGIDGEVKDSSGNGLDGTVINGAVTDDGALCKAGKFDSSKIQYIDVGDRDELDPGTRDWSISVWIKWNGGTNYRMVYNKEGLYEAGVYNGKFSFAWQPVWSFVGKIPITQGEWTHFVVTYDHQYQRLYKKWFGTEPNRLPEVWPK